MDKKAGKKFHWQRAFFAFFGLVMIYHSRLTLSSDGKTPLLDGNWYGAIIAIIVVSFIVSETIKNAKEVDIEVGPGGIKEKVVGKNDNPGGQQ
jgi:hypothetical protein